MPVTPVDYPIHALIASRWSPVGFDPRPVEPEKLRSMLEAARWAPSSRNAQPWRFVVGIRGEGETFSMLAECLTGRNREWAPQAPVLILAVALTVLPESGRPHPYALHDTGLATENLLLQAYACGLHAHPMAGFDADKVRAFLGIPDECQPTTMIAVGYLGTTAHLSESLRDNDARPRMRKPLRELVYGTRWGEAHPLVGAED
ncbi:MAG: nitroreductase family protein [Anaerolineales bacterium]